MANHLHTTWRHIRTLLGDAPANTTDAQLLSHFVAERDEAAFAELVRRHGPMVLGVCRRVLAHSHDAEDAYQATFLILSHKAASIRKGDALACWLHHVALHAALRLRRTIQQRTDRTSLPSEVPQCERDDVSWREVQRLLDEELARLPEQLRQPLILCYLEGKTRDEAAEELGWSLSTFRGRLERARERLRWRLERRGVTLSAALLATLAANAAEAALPTTTVSVQATTLATEVMRTMFLSKMKTLAVWCVALLFLSLGVGATVYQAVAVEASPPLKAVAPPKPPTPPEEDGIVKDYLAHLDSFDLSITLKPQEEKGKFNVKYELRNVRLHVAIGRFEPHAIGPTGKPVSGNARITKEQAAKIIDVLAKDNFFRESLGDAARLGEWKGSHAEMWASYHPDGAARTTQRWRNLEWTLPMVQHLAALRQCVDGDAAKLLDTLLKSLEEERTQWEKNDLFKVKKIEDVDALSLEQGEAKRLQVALDGVLPFNAWPKELTDEQKKLRDDGLKLAKKWLDGQTIFYYPSRRPDIGDTMRYMHGPTTVEEKWLGKTPYELAGWGGFNVNLLLIQEGYSPFFRPAVKDWDKNNMEKHFQAAQLYAMQNKKGIWNDQKFAEELMAIAARRARNEADFGLGSIKEWRLKAALPPAPDIVRDLIGALHYSPDGKTLLVTADKGAMHQLLDPATVKAGRVVHTRNRKSWVLGFTKDSQPWMLKMDPEEKLPQLPDGKKYRFVNLATKKVLWSVETLHLLRAAVLSSDGRYLAVILHDKPSLVVLWDAKTGKKLANLGEHKNGIERLTFSSDSKTLATASLHVEDKQAGEIKLWDVEKRAEKAACMLQAACKALQFTADGTRLFAATNRPLKDNPALSEGQVVWFDAALKEQGRRDGPTAGVKGSVTAFAASPDGKLFAVAWWEQRKRDIPERTLRVYDADRDKEIAAPEVTLVTTVLAFSPDGNFLATGEDQLTLAVWEALR